MIDKHEPDERAFAQFLVASSYAVETATLADMSLHEQRERCLHSRRNDDAIIPHEHRMVVVAHAYF